jgi:hypothetical protein
MTAAPEVFIEIHISRTGYILPPIPDHKKAANDQ